MVKNHEAALKDIAKVDKCIKLGDGNDDIDDEQDDDIDDENISVSSSMGQLFKSLTPVAGLVPAIDVSARPSLKKPFSALASSDSTLASATVSFEQRRSDHKRRHKPTQFFGTMIGGRGSHIVSSSNPSLMKHSLVLEQRQRNTAITSTAPMQLPTIDLIDTDKDAADRPLDIATDEYFRDDTAPDASMPDDNQAYDSDVNLDISADDDNSYASSNNNVGTDIDKADEYDGFYGVHSAEFESNFARLPIDNGIMYFEPGTVDDECFGPLQLTDITCPPYLYHM